MDPDKQVVALLTELKAQLDTNAETQRVALAAADSAVKSLEAKHATNIDRLNADFKKAAIDFTNALGEMDELKTKVKDLTAELVKGRRPGAGDGAGANVLTLGDLLVKSDSFNAYAEKGFGGDMNSAKLETTSTKSILAIQSIPTTETLPDLFPALHQPSIRDYIATRQTTDTAIEYIEETGAHNLYGVTRTAMLAAATTVELATPADSSEYGGNAGFYVGQTVTFTEGATTEDVTLLTVSDDGTTITFAATTNAFGIGATATSTTYALTPEMKLKPQASVIIEERTATVKTLATSITISNQLLADRPALAQRINQRLLHRMRIEEERQILYGDGSSKQLSGLMVNASVPTYAWSSGAIGDTKIDAVRKAMTLAFLGEYRPSAMMINPLDWQDMDAAKGTDGHYLFKQGTTGSNIGAGDKIFGMPVVVTTAIETGDFVLGAWGVGAEVVEREGITVRVGEQHMDYMKRNLKLVLVEERLTFIVTLPQAFVVGEFDVAPS